MSNENSKSVILIVDDSEINRMILSEILKNDYEIWEAGDGETAVSILSKHSRRIDLILLDIVMPDMDGFDVLSVMNKNQWIEYIPVIMISAEFKTDYIEKAYNMGVTDYIRRPYDSQLIHHRIVNTLALYDKQKKLKSIIEDQVYEKEKNSRMIINVLAHIVEFRNGESGLHVIHIQTVTRILLKALIKKTDKYKLTDNDILSITTASALHDIGKMSIDEKILNKPGKLTAEEFEIMKTHSAVGAEMLQDLPIFNEKTIMSTAYEICRWHHERYDGKGYPDALIGDYIPISAQVVSLADVYDALTSERCYKKAFSHEVAIEMIMDGQCGKFNPLLLECLMENEEAVREAVKKEGITESDSHLIQSVAEEIVEKAMDEQQPKHMKFDEIEREKINFYVSNIEEIQFDYDVNLDMVTISPYAARVLGLNEVIHHPYKKNHDFLGKENIMDLVEGIREETSPDNPEMRRRYMLGEEGRKELYEVQLRSLWNKEHNPKYIGVVGRIVKADK